MATRTTTVHEVIEQCRIGTSHAERGERFEKLMVQYSQRDPTLAATYDEAQRWPE